MTIPKAVTDTIAALRSERMPLAARLDAIDLAIDNLNRVYGLHGTPQPLPMDRRQPVRRTPKRVKADAATPDAPIGRSSDAIARRDVILGLLDRAAHGLTARDLRKATPKMADKDRSNALSILRVTGKITRAGNTWVAQRAAA